MSNALGTDVVTQIALVVNDVAAVSAKYAELLGLPQPPVVDSGEYETTGTTFRGQPAPQAACLMAFLDISPTTQLEIIQPGDAPSTWREHLDAHGEGVHHIAFAVRDTSGRLAALKEQFGWELLQRGKYGDGSGEYAYVDSAADLKIIVETLESW
jgi:catechol 2,3-dioxygenase-like lactoylglutathione lyase family enzyme